MFLFTVMCYKQYVCFSFPSFVAIGCKHFSALSHSSQGHPRCKSEHFIEGENPAHLKDVFLMPRIAKPPPLQLYKHTSVSTVKQQKELICLTCCREPLQMPFIELTKAIYLIKKYMKKEQLPRSKLF